MVARRPFLRRPARAEFRDAQPLEKSIVWVRMHINVHALISIDAHVRIHVKAHALIFIDARTHTYRETCSYAYI